MKVIISTNIQQNTIHYPKNGACRHNNNMNQNPFNVANKLCMLLVSFNFKNELTVSKYVNND